VNHFTEKYRDQIVGTLSGFDRLVFRGSLRKLNICYRREGLMVARGMEQYLGVNHILFKDYRNHVKKISEQIKAASLKPFRNQKVPVVSLRSGEVSKEDVARKIAAERKIETGLVCAISALEPSPTFEHYGRNIVRRIRPCHVLYQYQIHPVVGWMYARLQTWFPFAIQVGMNGREWLARQMKREKLGYVQQGNSFVWMEDYQRSQELMSEQLKMNWAELLGGFARQLNPIHESIFDEYTANYYWTTYQSEWASDVVFRDGDFEKRLMGLLVRHGMSSYGSADVMRFFGRKVNRSGAIPATFRGKLESDLQRRREGERVKYRMNGNSVKFYDKAYSAVGNVFRAAETTINIPTDFRAYRPTEGGPAEDLQWRPMRKGIADLHRRAEVSQHANERLMNALASVDDSRRVEELTEDIQKATVWGGRRVRGLHPWGDDKQILAAINRGEFVINGLRNRDLQALLYEGAATEAEKRKRSAAVSRKLRLLRAHGLIQKVPRTHRYQVTECGRSILNAVLTTARTSVHELNQLCKAA